MTANKRIQSFLLPLVAVCFLCGVSYGQGKSRTAFGLHQQFVQNRAIKGYKTPAGFRWKAQTFPGLVGANPSSGYWQNGRYHFYQQPRQVQPTQNYYQQPVQSYYSQQPAQSFYHQQPAAQSYYSQPVETYYWSR